MTEMHSKLDFYFEIEEVGSIEPTVNNESSECELLIHEGVEFLTWAIREESLNPAIEVSSFGKFQSIETLMHGGEGGALTAKCMIVEIGMHKLWIVVTDDTCRRVRRGEDNVEEKRHAFAEIIKFEGPLIIDSRSRLIEAIMDDVVDPRTFFMEEDIPDNNTRFHTCGPGFLVGAYETGKKMEPAQPRNILVNRLDREFRDFLREVQTGEPGEPIRFRTLTTFETMGLQ